MVNTYVPNNLVRLSCAFTVGPTATDPTTVSLTVKDPLGARTTYTYAGATITKDSTGNYHRDFIAVAPGPWNYAWDGTGACEAASEGEFRISRSKVA